MSEEVINKGTLIEIEVSKYYKTLSEQVTYLQTRGYEFVELDLKMDYFDAERTGLIKYKDRWFEIKNTEIDGYEDIAEASYIGSTIHYTLKFYNGGTCFDEMLELALDKLNGEDEE